MKIVCDSCSAKYSIADEKVAGRVFKIRCKKCGAAIVVRGDQVDTPEEEPSAQAVDYGGDAVWHIVIDGDQQGPYAPSQIGEMLSVGTIGWDAFVWREGFDDWKPAQDIEELVSAVMGEGGEGSAEEAAPAASDSAEMGADPFAAPAAASEPAPAAEPAGGDLFGGGRDEGADLFAATADSSPFGAGDDEEDDLVASASGPRVSADQALTGARNENSVLFSLSNLQALATGSSDSSAPSSPAPAMGTAKPGMAAGEGSGLIDIRALASATGMTGEGPITSASDERVDDLLSIGGGGGMGSSLGAPVLIPEQREEGSNKGLIIGLAVAGVAVVSLVAVLAVVLMGGEDPAPVAPAGALGPVQSGETTSTEATPAGDDSSPEAAGTETPTDTATETATADPVGGEEPAGGGDEEAADDEGHVGAAGGGRRRRRRTSGGGGGSTAAATPPASTGGGGSASGGRRRASGGDSIDSLLDDALAGGGGGGASGGRSRRGGGGGASGGGASGPQTPTRGSVVSAMSSVSGAVQACGNGAHGLAPVRIVFNGGTGRVTSANVSGGNFPGPVRSCIARAARGARVPPFRQPTFSVNYPFRL